MGTAAAEGNVWRCCTHSNVSWRLLLDAHGLILLFNSEATERSYESPLKQESSFILTLPWLITPGKVWPPAVNTDPAVDVQFARPQDHLRAQLYSAEPPGGTSPYCTSFIFSLLPIESGALLLVPVWTGCLICFKAAVRWLISGQHSSTFSWKHFFLPV